MTKYFNPQDFEFGPYFLHSDHYTKIHICFHISQDLSPKYRSNIKSVLSGLKDIFSLSLSTWRVSKKHCYLEHDEPLSIWQVWPSQNRESANLEFWHHNSLYSLDARQLNEITATFGGSSCPRLRIDLETQIWFYWRTIY